MRDVGKKPNECKNDTNCAQENKLDAKKDELYNKLLTSFCHLILGLDMVEVVVHQEEACDWQEAFQVSAQHDTSK